MSPSRESSEPRFACAAPDDVADLSAVHAAVATHLTETFGQGPWSRPASGKSVLGLPGPRQVLVARVGKRIVATLTLATRKPWAIDRTYFTDCQRPLYLTNMAVLPDLQRSGLGRRCLDEAIVRARAWPADAIRLDAYDAPAGAGGFYARCGFREQGRVTYRKAPLIYYECLL